LRRRGGVSQYLPRAAVRADITGAREAHRPAGLMTVTEKNKQKGTAAARMPERGANGGPEIGGERQPLHRCVTDALARYFAALDGELPVSLYELVMTEVERPLLEFVMQELGGNQSRAAEILGLNRGTLRKKLLHHRLLES
jgi:Fis family transcriptional regulator, factor for inversion stimulation protein